MPHILILGTKVLAHIVIRLRGSIAATYSMAVLHGFFLRLFGVPVEQLLKDLQLFFMPDTTTTLLHYTIH